MRYMASMEEPAVTVSSMKTSYASRKTTLDSVGSLRAIMGVNVTTSLLGMVQTILFHTGAIVSKDTIPVQLNADPQIGQLHSLEAQVELAKITYNRDKAQFAVNAVSKQQEVILITGTSKILRTNSIAGSNPEKLTIRAPLADDLAFHK